MSATSIALAVSVAVTVALAARVEVVGDPPPAPVLPVDRDPRCDSATLDAELAEVTTWRESLAGALERARTRDQEAEALDALDRANVIVEATLELRWQCQSGHGP